MNVLIILGHPRKESLCGALAEAYRQGAEEAGQSVQLLAVADLNFNPNVSTRSILDMPLEPDIQRSIEALKWADHLVFVYPGWWGLMPAMLKGFLDRTLLPGVAFGRRPDGGPLRKLWIGKSAQVLTTLDTPLKVYQKQYQAPGDNAVRHAIMGFCGVEPVHVQSFTPAREASDAERAHWLEQCRDLGRALKHGFQRTRQENFALWIKALRLQFYPKTFFVYTLGAMLALLSGAHFSWPIFLLGYLSVFALEAATVFSNDLFDEETDRLNQHFTAMNGGSRLMVEGKLTSAQLKNAILVAITGGMAATAAAIGLSPGLMTELVLLYLASAILCLGYTVPPLRLSYRTLGEVTVVLASSVLPLMWAFGLQGGSLHDGFPWLVGVPLAFASFPGITLAAIPDHKADAAVGKKTLAVRLGVNGAVTVGIAFTAISAVMAVGWLFIPGMQGLFVGAGVVAIPYAVMLIRRLLAYLRQPEKSPLINPLIGGALVYSMWFSVAPLLAVWWKLL